MAACWRLAGTPPPPHPRTRAAVARRGPRRRHRRTAPEAAPGCARRRRHSSGPPSPAQVIASLRALGDDGLDALQRATVSVLRRLRSPRSGQRRPPVGPAGRTGAARRPSAARRGRRVAASGGGHSASLSLPLGLVTVGERPFHPLEVAEQLGLPLLGVVADDPAAASLVDRTIQRALLRTRLARVAELARAVERLAAERPRTMRPVDQRRRGGQCVSAALLAFPRRGQAALCARSGRQAGAPAGADDERRHGEDLIAAALERINRERLVAGAEPLDVELEEVLLDEVRAQLFGFGVLDRLLVDPDIENLHANGCDRVFITRAGAGGRARRLLARTPSWSN